MSGKWVVDYGFVNPNINYSHIEHKSFITEKAAVEWGKTLVGQTLNEGAEKVPINYIHKVYEPDYLDLSIMPLQSDEEVADVSDESSAAVSEAEDKEG